MSSVPLESFLEDSCLSIISMFFSTIFKGSHLILQSLIHFKLIFFVQGERNRSGFIFLHVVIELSKHRLLNRLSFLPMSFWHNYQKSGGYSCAGLFIGFLTRMKSRGFEIYVLIHVFLNSFCKKFIDNFCLYINHGNWCGLIIMSLSCFNDQDNKNCRVSSVQFICFPIYVRDFTQGSSVLGFFF